MYNLRQFWHDQATWANRQFGHGGPEGSLKHLKKEVDELLENPCDLEEYADAMHLIFDSCRRAGFSFDQLVKKCQAKLKINKKTQVGQSSARRAVRTRRIGVSDGEPTRPRRHNEKGSGPSC